MDRYYTDALYTHNLSHFVKPSWICHNELATRDTIMELIVLTIHWPFESIGECMIHRNDTSTLHVEKIVVKVHQLE